jgi:hypothetical protein
MVGTTQLPLMQGLRYLFSHDDGAVVAHCLDLDIVTSGVDINDAEESLNALVLTQIASCFASGNLSQLLIKAPKEYWECLTKAKLLGHAELQVEVPPVLIAVEKRMGSLQIARFEIHEDELVAA